MRLFPNLSQEAEWNFLRNEVGGSQFNEMQFKYLVGQGLTGALSDMIYKFKSDLPPIIDSFTVGTQVGTSLPIELIFHDDQSPSTVQIVGVLSGGSDPFGGSAPISIGPFSVTDIYSASPSVAGVAGGVYDFYALVTDSSGQTDIASQLGVTITESFSVSRISPNWPNNTTLSTTAQVTFDLTGYSAGSQLVIVYGPNEYPTTFDLTETGESAVALTASAYGNTGQNFTMRSSVYLHTMAVDGGSTTVDITGVSTNARFMAVYVIAGGSVTDGGTSQSQVASVTLTNTLTPNDTTNTVLNVAMGNDWLTSTFVNCTQDSGVKEELVGVGLYSCDSATATDVATSATNFQFTPSSESSRYFLTSLLVEPS